MNVMGILNSCGQQGVAALSAATPLETGLASHSWTYEVAKTGGGYTITWLNTDVESGFPVAIMLQYGYGTGTGGYVQGRDYINPAMRPIFDSIAEKVWKAVTSA
jgi:hypothetical protein